MSDSSYLIEDLIVMDCNDEHVEFLILTKYTKENDRCIKIIDYPGNNPIFNKICFKIFIIIYALICCYRIEMPQ